MVTAFEFDKYLEHSKEDSYRIHQDEKNFSSLRTFILILSIVTGFITITTFFDGSVDYDSYSNFTAFIVSLLLRIFYNRIFSVETIRRKIFILFVTALILFLLSAILQDFIEKKKPVADNKARVEKLKNNDNQDDQNFDITIDQKKTGTATIVIYFVLSLIFFRFPKSDQIQLFSLAIGLPLLTDLIFFQDFGITGKIPMFITTLLCFVISYSSENKRHKKFNREYDVYFKRHSETLRMKKELDYAREIQLSMLPESRKSIGDLRIAATSLPASEVGGDYYDYFNINDDLTGIFICDVSGHGVASALLLSGLRSCMHLILEDTSNPKEVLVKLNKMVRRTQNRKMFVTAVFAVIDTKNNKCTLFNAGHLPPYKISGESHELFKIKRHGITLGAVDNFISDEEDNLVTFDFKKGDKLLLYTDGIIEAMDNVKNEYGFTRLEDFLYKNTSGTPSDLLDGLISDVNRFSDGAEQVDDISILVLSRN
ncbi:MAG: PP2C family protein-serine/threonine phosphatase [Ignavibacteriota bacterium]